MTQQSWNTTEPDDVQMPLGIGGESEFTPEPEAKPKLSGPTLVLFGAFAAGLLVIYLLGVQSKPRAASADQIAREMKVKSAIAELLEKNGQAAQLDNLFKDTDKLMKMFHSYFGGEGRDAPALEHDPFANDDPRPVAAGPAEEAVQLVSTNAVEAEKLRKVAETFNTLKLKSVMLGRTSIATINNSMVTVGAKLGDLTVTGIEADRVLLSYGKNKFELKLNQPGMDAQ